MYKYEVGKLLQDGITKYDEETKFNFQQDGAVLIIFFKNPKPDEIENIKIGKAEIGFWKKDKVIFVLSKFGKLNWMDAPYNVHLSKEFEFQRIEENQGFGLHIVLVDAATGIIKGMRLIGLSTDFSQKIKAAIETQKLESFDVNEYGQIINRIYGNYSTKDMIKYADAIFRIKGEY